MLFECCHVGPQFFSFAPRIGSPDPPLRPRGKSSRLKHAWMKSSGSSSFMCDICADRKPFKKSFAIKGCTCSYCIRQYVTSKVEDNITRISCPVSDCSGSLEPEHCRSILPSKVFNKWEDALLETVIPDSDKFYCPSKDCSALLVKGHDFEDIVKSECQICHKLFCAKCKVPWHSRIKCTGYQKLHKDEREGEDIIRMQLAKKTRESTVSSSFTCGICMDRKPFKKSFAIKGCNHSYCSDCICQYVHYKIQDKITRIYCPVWGCHGRLKAERCRSILPSKVYNKWQDMISARDKFYCPFNDCSALLVKGPNYRDICELECPICHRLFCAKCTVPWHYEITCREFQGLHKDEREREDIMLMQLAKKNNWARCSKCKFYVERTAGCLFMRCRCGHTFCYSCGAYLSAHYCTNCRH